MAEAFVYRWRHARSREWYIGYHSGTAHDGYVCSSKIARPRIITEPEWSRKILRWGTKKQMLALERRLLKHLNARANAQSLNRSNGGPTPPVSIWVKLGYNFNTMSAQQIAQHYKAELDRGDPDRIVLCNLWLVKKLVT